MKIKCPFCENIIKIEIYKKGNCNKCNAYFYWNYDLTDDYEMENIGYYFKKKDDEYINSILSEVVDE